MILNCLTRSVGGAMLQLLWVFECSFWSCILLLRLLMSF